MAETDGSPSFNVVVTGDGVNINKELDQETARMVIDVIFGGEAPTGTAQSRRSRTSTRKRAGRSQAKTRTGSKRSPRRSGGPGVVKDLSLRPKGKKALADFVKEKQPKTHQQKQAVIVYWLQHEAGMTQGITVDHINTCYRGADWPRPKNLANALSVTATVTGWLDTSDKQNITLTTPGEDLVQHELPPAAKSKQ